MTTGVVAPRVMFIDDESPFLDTVKSYFAFGGPTVLTSTDPERGIDAVRRGEVDSVVTDLKMPGVDGVALCQKLRDLAPSLSLTVLTGFLPTSDETKRLEALGARIHLKFDDLPEFLSGFTDEPPPPAATQLAALQGRLAGLERVNREWTADLVESLGAIPNGTDTWVQLGADRFTVTELIKDITDMTPRGLEHIKLWRSVLKRLRSMGRVR